MESELRSHGRSCMSVTESVLRSHGRSCYSVTESVLEMDGPLTAGLWHGVLGGAPAPVVLFGRGWGCWGGWLRCEVVVQQHASQPAVAVLMNNLSVLHRSWGPSRNEPLLQEATMGVKIE